MGNVYTRLNFNSSRPNDHTGFNSSRSRQATCRSTGSTDSGRTNSSDFVSYQQNNQKQPNNVSNNNNLTAAYMLNEEELRKWCRGFNKEFPDAQLTHILDNEDLLAPFLTDIFYQEVEVSDCMQTLFRGNCLASKIMSHCFRTFGSKYLKQLLEPHIKPLTLTTATAQRKINNKSDNSNKKQNDEAEEETVAFNLTQKTTSTTSSPVRATSKSLNTDSISNDRLLDLTADIENTAQFDNNINEDDDYLSNTFSYEIDSTKLEVGNGNIYVNQRNLLKLTRKILESILASANDFPPQLNSMCICLRQVLCKKYPNSNTNLRAVGTVIFLRFINPAIVSPYEAGIVDIQPPQKIMRGLMLVSKILQNIANNVEFSKEEHMLPFNDFVRTQFEPMKQWVSKISSEQADV